MATRNTKQTNTPVTDNTDVQSVQESTTEVVKDVDVTVAPVKKPVTYAPDHFVTCRSVTAGELIMVGRKSGTIYLWAGMDDTCEVEHQDLVSEKANRSNFLYKPRFIIEDSEYLKQPKWGDIEELYEEHKAEIYDISEIIDLPVADFRYKMNHLPVGLRSAVRDLVADGLANGTFDSIQKVKIVDEVCGSDLMVELRN
jgi:hypothetical protein